MTLSELINHVNSPAPAFNCAVLKGEVRRLRRLMDPGKKVKTHDKLLLAGKKYIGSTEQEIASPMFSVLHDWSRHDALVLIQVSSSP